MKKGIFVVLAALLLSGCASMGTGPQAQAADTEGGALLGALAGAVIGNQTGAPLAGAAIGAGIGGLAGSAVGAQR